MADAYIGVAEGTDKKLQTFSNTVSGNVVHSEAVTPTDQTGVPLSLIPFGYDYVGLSSYTTDNQPQTVVHKTGGSGGTTVATLTLAYSGGSAGGNLTSVTRS